ncbi:lactonase family protein [Acinetobacter baumannii]|uniref:lactonase family protein n=1 Tax=Acinetobacter baumannii TaxID=470 RepID=UPI00280F5F40|nr:lactonase family protein [Acinetobacter baumannii]MDQ8918286.1 lactonase family protein [Acinetobacter baumannii]MDQ8949240.1 lactonase family protein [Acinetobacter baumannii]MDQ8963408.1 lactonase family protein [Acinetobacter baumannii]MDQ8967095.1 lactonase family protein [Acinetobacter baumannii]MDQ8981101.1 lactonase family protein [Acinetobacter baumannii]
MKIDTDVNTGYGKDTDKNGYANIKYRELIQKLTVTLSLTLLSFGWGSTVNAAQQQIALVGTWTSIPDAPLVQKPEKASEGLYQLQVNADGTLTPVKVLQMKSPSWVVKSKDGRFAYTTNEENEGAVTALSVQNGKVEVLNTVNSHGGHPTHASISLDGKFLFVSNYSAFDKGRGGVAVLPILPNGHLGEMVQNIVFAEGSGHVKGRQDSGHAHSTTFSPDGKYLYASDLGNDKVYAFRYNPSNPQPLEADKSRDVSFKHGSGPRHMVFSPNGKQAYITAEMRSEIVTFNVQDGHLKKVAELKLVHEDKTPEFKSASGIILSPNGKYVIAANRGADNKLLVFKIQQNGLLGQPQVYKANGIEPRAFSFDESGKYLYVTNVYSNNISLFRFDTKNGSLKPLGDAAKISTPTDIKFF